MRFSSVRITLRDLRLLWWTRSLSLSVTPYILVDRYQRFEGTYCLHFREENYSFTQKIQAVASSETSTKLHGIRSEKILILQWWENCSAWNRSFLSNSEQTSINTYNCLLQQTRIEYICRKTLNNMKFQKIFFRYY